jgi:hypothetical protein
MTDRGLRMIQGWKNGSVAIGYLLLTMSILWFSKIKEILEYKKNSEVLKSEQASEIDIDNEANESVEFIENSNQILGIMTTVSEKPKGTLTFYSLNMLFRIATLSNLLVF